MISRIVHSFNFKTFQLSTYLLASRIDLFSKENKDVEVIQIFLKSGVYEYLEDVKNKKTDVQRL